MTTRALSDAMAAASHHGIVLWTQPHPDGTVTLWARHELTDSEATRELTELDLADAGRLGTVLDAMAAELAPAMRPQLEPPDDLERTEQLLGRLVLELDPLQLHALPREPGADHVLVMVKATGRLRLRP